MSFDLVSTSIYPLPLLVCKSKYLNSYKIEQIDTRILHDIIHVALPHRINIYTQLNFR